MKEVVSVSHIDHPYSPIYNAIFSCKTPFWKYAINLNHLILSVLVPAIEEGVYIKKLRIHSHGNKNPPGLRAEKGPVIRMGDGNISLYDFNQDGDPYPGPIKDFLIALERTLAENAKITFDACNQGPGELLKNISRFLGKNITVAGFSGLGAPLIRGNLCFRNGRREKLGRWFWAL